jgi:hypothetical protein
LADIASEQRRLSSDLVSSQELLRQERATIQAKAAAQMAVLEAEINEIKVRDSIDERVKSAVYAGLKMDRTASQTAISGTSQRNRTGSGSDGKRTERTRS